MNDRKAKALIFCISILSCIIVFEIGLRIAGLSYPEFNRLDDRLGWMPRAGTEGMFAIEGRIRMQINDAGFRDINHPVDKPEGTFRIAILGDSFTEAREVNLDQTYWKVMEQELTACMKPGERTPEVLNFGVNGYGTAQQLIVLRDHVQAYKPDLVVLAFFTGNDVWNNSRRLDGHKDRPFFVIKNGTLVLDDSNHKTAGFKTRLIWHDIKHGLYNIFRTVQVGRQAYLRVKGWLKYRERSVIERLSAGLNPGFFSPPKDDAWKEAWQVTEELIRTLNSEVQAKNGDFWLTTLSAPVQVYPDADVRTRFANRFGADDLMYPDLRLARLAQAESIPVTTLAYPMRRFADANKTSLHGTGGVNIGGHWNADGHRIAGQTLAHALCGAYAKN